MYIDDIFQLQKEGINTILANSLIHYAIIPALIAPFTSDQKVPFEFPFNKSLYLGINQLKSFLVSH